MPWDVKTIDDLHYLSSPFLINNIKALLKKITKLIKVNNKSPVQEKTYRSSRLIKRENKHQGIQVSFFFLYQIS